METNNPDLQNKFDASLARAEQILAEKGFTVISTDIQIDPENPQSPVMPHAYTVGRGYQGKAEIFVFGLPGEISVEIIYEIAAYLDKIEDSIEDKVHTVEGDRCVVNLDQVVFCDKIFIDKKAACVPTWEIPEQVCNMTKYFYMERDMPLIGAYQVMLNDTQGRMPWDAQYEDRMRVFPVITKVEVAQ